jgi:hypothetical protein
VTVIFLKENSHHLHSHIYRQLWNAGNAVDLTGPMMVIAIKVSSISWNFYDGLDPNFQVRPRSPLVSICINVLGTSS